MKILQEQLGYQFRDLTLLEHALTHSSYVRGKNLPAEKSNERLEFLGDAVLDLAIATILYKKYPHIDEGLLTKAQADLSSRDNMARLGTSLNLGQYLKMAENEERCGSRNRPTLIGNAMEAVFGAIYLDSDYNTIENCIHHLLKDAIDAAPFNHQTRDNPKGELQEYLAAKHLALPVYEIVGTSGPGHNLIIECRILINGQELARAKSHRRQSAEAACARIVLEELQKKRS